MPPKKRTKVDSAPTTEPEPNQTMDPKEVNNRKKEGENEKAYKLMAARRKKFKEPTREPFPNLVFEELGDPDDTDWALPSDLNPHAKSDEAIQAATAFLEQNRDVRKDEITITHAWNRLDIACKNSHHFSLTSSDQLPVISSTPMTAIEACLLISSPLSCVGMFSAAVQEAVQAKSEGKGPSFSKCLIWLAFAVQSPVSQIIPAGEYFMELDQYIEEHLIHPKLYKIDEDSRPDLVVTNITRIFEYLTVCDLSSLSDEEKAILLYAIGRILLDNRLPGLHVVQDKAVGLFSQVLSCSKTPRSVIWEFGQLLPRICDDLRGHRMILDIVKKSEAPFHSCICLLAFIFLSISERGECALDIMEEISDEGYAKEYADSIADMIDNVMEVYSKKNRHQQEAVLSMLASSLHPTIVRIMSEDTRKVIESKLKRSEYDWRRDNHTDDQILQRVFVSAVNILNEEIDQKSRGLGMIYH